MRNRPLGVYLVNLLMGIIEALILLRIILKLFGANPYTPFVQWIYNLTMPLLAPFRNIFPSPVIAERYELELTSIFALIVYGLLAYFLTQFFLMLNSPNGKEK
ncbi:YggT family protein [Alkalihalobacillus sp. AL-G]|uniref:YggT family protein n=1 Tax=Alkalihalobacillus sp. AL-G TaxID=2926399 RepID=UPI00272C0691|nr:YggT family protein [Alkalihalobacillus sp. AL-G]WLD92658.1 YggT family protein [Alkalihalobacillus sp. AL-G]